MVSSFKRASWKTNLFNELLKLNNTAINLHMNKKLLYVINLENN